MNMENICVNLCSNMTSPSSVAYIKPNEDYDFLCNEFGLKALNDIIGNVRWKKIGENSPDLNLEYTILFEKKSADFIFKTLEEELVYFTGDLCKVRVFGKYHEIPRKQVTFGDEGLVYRFSGITTPALPWPPILASIRSFLQKITGYHYNFVLVNRYKDGLDKVGEHKDNEKDIDQQTPIASLSFGQPREFYFKHQDARPPNKKLINKVNIVLEHGSLLLMKYPTNYYWYHALPPRKAADHPRINLTFRKIIPLKSKNLD